MRRSFLLFLSSLIGFNSLVYQTAGFQIVFLFFVSGYSAVAISTSSFLVGIASASLIFSRFSKRESVFKVLSILSLLNVAFTFLVLKHFTLIPELLKWSHDQGASFLKILIFWIFLFIPAFLIGGTFPMINGLYLNSVEKASSDTGKMYFADTMGAALGSLLTGLFLLPVLGLDQTLTIAGLLSSLIFVFMTYLLKGVKLALLGLAILVGVSTYGYFKFSQNSLDARFGKVLFQKKSDFGNITVGTVGDYKRLFINYREMCNENQRQRLAPWSVSSNQLSIDTAANLPLNSKVLNIGLGCGMTAKYLIQSDRVSHLDIAEINPVILEAAKNWFSNENEKVTENPKVSVKIENGADYLQQTETHYDAIVIDIEEVAVIYSSPLYTLDYFKIMKGRMTKDGVLSIWSFSSNVDFVKVLFNTMQKAFRHVEIQFFGSAVNLYASDRELQISPARYQKNDFVDQVRNSTNAEINTLDQRTLEKYYHSNQIFDLPADYHEKFVR